MVEYVKGNLFDEPQEIIVHGCNARGVMGAGFAKDLKEKYPENYKEYRKYCNNCKKIRWRTLASN